MEQLDLFNLLSSDFFATKPLGGTLRLADEDYLNRDNSDKVISLVRKKEEKKLELSKFFTMFNKNKLKDTEYVFEKLVEWARSQIVICDEEDNYDAYFSKELLLAIGDNFYAEYAKGLIYYHNASDILLRKCYGVENIKHQFVDEDKETGKWITYTVGKIRKHLRNSHWYFRGRKESSMEHINDVCVPIAMAIILNELLKRENIKDIAKELLLDSLRYYIDESNNSIYYCPVSAEDERKIKELSVLLDIPFIRVNSVESKINGKMVLTSGGLYSKHCAYLALLDFFFTENDKTAMARNIYSHYGNLVGVASYFADLYCEKVLCFDIEIKNMIEYNKRTSSDYAKSFETKKNIPLGIQKAMKESDFNNFFGGMVEFDELCDVTKVSELEKEWRALSEKYFGGMKFGDVSLRFRRLGNHKASGLYYPGFRCICVDINNPSSMVHEFGHMIDDGSLTLINGDYLSLKPDFDEIKKLYRKHIDKADGLKNVKGKYGADYYNTPTEVFARCFEMYVSRVLGVSNSLVKDVHSFAYPDDEKLMEEIKEYFDNLFGVLFTERGDCDGESECSISDPEIYRKVSNS